MMEWHSLAELLVELVLLGEACADDRCHGDGCPVGSGVGGYGGGQGSGWVPVPVLVLV